MKYSCEYKRMCVEMYREGKWPETPEGIQEKMGSATQVEKAALVKELREEGYALKYLLAVMELSKSTYYYEIGKTDKIQERNADISSKIESISQENKGRYGVRRVYRELARRGFPVNHKRVQRIWKHSLGA